VSSADHRPGPLFEEDGINRVFDPVRRALFGVLSVLTLGFYRDTQFRQFAVLARLSRGEAR